MRKILICLCLLWLAGCATSPAAQPDVVTTPTTATLDYEREVPFGVIEVLDMPQTVSVAEATGHIAPNDLVMGMTINGESRAYPIGLMRRYEIANDVLGGDPIAVTFCPSCNTGLSFERTVEGQVLDFDFSGMTLDNAMVMQDEQTGTMWSQVRLQAVEGELTGQRLELLASNQMTWQEWVATNPDTTLILDPRAPAAASVGFQMPVVPTGAEVNPDAYHGYIAGIARDDTVAAFPLDAVTAQGVVNSDLPDLPLLLVGMGEPGDVTVWERTVEGQTLTFTRQGEQLIDNETQSVWNPRTGVAESGDLAGQALTAADVWVCDWRGWQDLYPNTSLELQS